MTTNLSGSLSEFNLAEVLSLLGMGGRTAHMRVTSSDSVGTVHMVDGRISSATADSARAGLLRGLVAALPVPVDDLAQALQSEDPVRALVDSGVVDRDAAQHVAGEYCTEAVGEMLAWTSGEFAVWVGSQDSSDIGVRLGVDELVAAARERSQEWHDLRAALPESDSVLALVPGLAQAPVVDMDDWAVLARVDGRRTLSEVLAAMGASPLAAGNRLVQLMGRGLVSVKVGGGDAEQDQANQMLDAFDDPGRVDEVIEVVASQEPEYVPDVHDLFVTEPEAVQEWQVAAADSWADSELEPVVSLGTDPDPVPTEEHVPASEWSALVAPEFPAGAEPVLSQDSAPEVEPASDELEQVGFLAEPATFDIEPEAPDSVPVTFELEPVSEPVAEAFAWSPWAQEMGLGEAPVTTAAEPVPFVGHGFADMVEDADGHGHTEAFPVPQAPARVEADIDSPKDDSGVVDDAHEVASFVPQPRDPGDGAVDPSAYAQTVGVHAANPEYALAPEAVAGDEAGAGAVDAPADSAADPLAGGLLAHLMSSVRGL